MTVRVKINSKRVQALWQEAKKELRRLPTQFRFYIAAEGMFEAAKIVAAEARRTNAFIDRSKKLRRSIRPRRVVRGRSRGFRTASFTGARITARGSAVFAEYGTIHRPATFFLLHSGLRSQAEQQRAFRIGVIRQWRAYETAIRATKFNTRLRLRLGGRY